MPASSYCGAACFEICQQKMFRYKWAPSDVAALILVFLPGECEKYQTNVSLTDEGKRTSFPFLLVLIYKYT